MQILNEIYLRALANRDVHAESDLISSFKKSVTTMLRGHLRSPHAVEDAYQETLLRVFMYFRGGGTLRAPSSLSGFVHSVGRNVALEIIRAQSRDNPLDPIMFDPIDQAANPEDRLMTEERTRIVQRLLGELGSRDRLLLRRVYLEEADKDQVCKEFRISRQYLRLLLRRARLRCMTLLREKRRSPAALPVYDPPGRSALDSSHI